MPLYTVIKNTRMPADAQGRVYNCITAVLKAEERTVDTPTAIARRFVISTDPIAQIVAGQELDVTVTLATQNQ